MSALSADRIIPPRRPPDIAGLQLFRHPVDAGGTVRAAAANAKQRQQAAGPKPVAGHRLVAIFRTGRQVAAGIADEAG